MRVVNLKMLKDGSGRACIHWFVRDPEGKIETPGRVEIIPGAGVLQLGGARGRICCHPEQNSVMPHQRGQDVFLCMRTDEPRAVSCPDCMATEEYKRAMEEIEAVAG